MARSEWALGFRRQVSAGADRRSGRDIAAAADAPMPGSAGAVPTNGNSPLRGAGVRVQLDGAPIARPDASQYSPPRRESMRGTQFEDKWGRIRGSVAEQWCRLTNDDLDAIRTRDQLLARLQERYAKALEVLEQELDAFEGRRQV